MKFFAALCTSHPFTGKTYREAVVIEASNESEATRLFEQTLARKYGNLPYEAKLALPLRNWGHVNLFAVVQKSFHGQNSAATASFAMIHHYSGTIADLRHYLQRDWHCMGAEDLADVSVWDYHPAPLAHMEDSGLVYAHLFEVD